MAKKSPTDPRAAALETLKTALAAHKATPTEATAHAARYAYKKALAHTHHPKDLSEDEQATLADIQN